LFFLNDSQSSQYQEELRVYFTGNIPQTYNGQVYLTLFPNSTSFEFRVRLNGEQYFGDLEFITYPETNEIFVERNPNHWGYWQVHSTASTGTYRLLLRQANTYDLFDEFGGDNGNDVSVFSSANIYGSISFANYFDDSTPYIYVDQMVVKLLNPFTGSVIQESICDQYGDFSFSNITESYVKIGFYSKNERSNIKNDNGENIILYTFEIPDNSLGYAWLHLQSGISLATVLDLNGETHLSVILDNNSEFTEYPENEVGPSYRCGISTGNSGDGSLIDFLGAVNVLDAINSFVEMFPYMAPSQSVDISLIPTRITSAYYNSQTEQGQLIELASHPYIVDQLDDYVIDHEYAHFIMDDLMNLRIPYTDQKPKHTIWGNDHTKNFCYKEAFAEFYGGLASGTNCLNNVNKVGGWHINVFNGETLNQLNRPLYSECPTDLPTSHLPAGANIEARVVGTLWDLTDASDDANQNQTDLDIFYDMRSIWDDFNFFPLVFPIVEEWHKPYNIYEFSRALLGEYWEWSVGERTLFASHGTYGGSIIGPQVHFTENTRLSGTNIFEGDAYVDAGVHLSILPGTVLCFPENSKLIVNGSLVADGISSDSTIVFMGDFADQQPNPPDYIPSFYWRGIMVESPTGNIDLNYVSVKYANTGLGLLKSETDVTLSNLTVSHCITGIEVSRSKGSTLIENSTINNNIVGLNIEEASPAILNSKLNFNERCGIFVSYGSNPKLNNNEIMYNGLSHVGDMSTGGIVSIASNPQMYIDFNPSTPFCETNNTIAENGTAGLISLQNSTPNLGVYKYDSSNPEHAFGGFNRIFNNSLYSIYHDEMKVTLPAQVNYWTQYISNDSVQLGDPCESGYPDRLIGDVMRSPLAPIIGLSKAVSSNSSQSDFIKQLIANEQYTDAIILIDSIVIENEDSSWVVDLLSDMSICYDYTNSIEMADNKFDDYQLNFPQSNLAYWAIFFQIPFQIREDNYSDALANLAWLESNSESSTVPYLIIEESHVLECQSEAGLSKGTVESYIDENYKTVIDNYSKSPAADLAKYFLNKREGIPSSSGQIIPNDFILLQNYPNPFNPITTIDYVIPSDASVAITIYNMAGEEVFNTAPQMTQAGWHKFQWNGLNKNGTHVPSGVYFGMLQLDGFHSRVIKMVCLK